MKFIRQGGRRSAQRGFTLIELMVALTLLALLTVVAMPLNDLVKQREKESELRRALITVRTAIDAYKRAADEGRIDRAADASGYPPELSVLVNGATDKKSLDGRKIYFLRKLPADPMCDCPDTPAADTWETRTYEDPPGQFSGGRDVFDIRSKQSGMGINGTPYNEW